LMLWCSDVFRKLVFDLAIYPIEVLVCESV